ncbi:MAG: hypothetical protein NTW86_28510, partial [Candidatus Sumerlaeota bacterium]|nr:hypothetical protein [Candidatus Sumerlaeota bacterium]
KKAKEWGFSDKYLAKLFSVKELAVRKRRRAIMGNARFEAVPVSGVKDAAFELGADGFLLEWCDEQGVQHGIGGEPGQHAAGRLGGFLRDAVDKLVKLLSRWHVADAS